MILLSSEHQDVTISENSSKPDIILHYNQCKGAVDSFDRVLADYSCQRGTQRWTLVVFYNIVDIAWFNGYIIYMKQHPSYMSGKNHKRRIYIEDLAFELVMPYMIRRKNSANLSHFIKTGINEILQYKKQNIADDVDADVISTISTQKDQRKRCFLCPRAKDKKTNLICYKCTKFVCRDCLKQTNPNLCSICFD